MKMVWVGNLLPRPSCFLRRDIQAVMGKEAFKAYLCRPYCMFFKDGAKEETACRAAEVVNALVNKKQVDIKTIPPFIKNRLLWEKCRNTLGNTLCSSCSFRAEDCDFQSATPSDDLEPCGGFIVLAHLWVNNLIQESDLE